MKIKITFILFLLSCMVTLPAQEIKFKSYKSAYGVMDKMSDGIYSWQMWKQDTTSITIDLQNDSIYVNDEVYTIIERPKRWVIKKNLKYVSFSCGDEFFNKVNVKLYQYDSGEFRVYVMQEEKATKYTVKYLGDSTPRILLDKSDVKAISDEKKQKQQEHSGESKKQKN